MNKIDYVVISSDDNPTYKDLYDIVAKQWYDLGFKTYYINITTENSIHKTEYGIVHKIKGLENISTAFQSQVIRLFVSNLVEDKNLLMSDIDMLPLNKKYFEDFGNNITKDKIIVLSGQPYGNNPFYPMCYILGNSNLLQKVLQIENLTFDEYCSLLLKIYGEKWNTDENFMFDMFQKNQQSILVIKDRDFRKRIDRSEWKYDIELLKEGYYIDSHLLRPLKTYHNEINKLLSEIQ